MTHRAPVWGYLGGPEGNGSSVAVYAPIVLDGQGRPSAWSGGELRPLRDADEVGTRVDAGLEASPDDVVVVVGERWLSRLQEFMGLIPQSLAVELPRVLNLVWVTTPDSARAFRRTAARAALWVYDAQRDGSAKQAALEVLRQDDGLDPVTRAVRVLDATFDEVERYLTRLQVEARMTGLSAEALQERVLAYRTRAAMTERSAPQAATNPIGTVALRGANVGGRTGRIKAVWWLERGYTEARRRKVIATDIVIVVPDAPRPPATAVADVPGSERFIKDLLNARPKRIGVAIKAGNE